MRSVLLRSAALLLPLILAACSEVTTPGPLLDGSGAGGLLSGECTRQADGSYLCPPITNDPVYPSDPCMESTGSADLESTTQSCPPSGGDDGSTAPPPDDGSTGGDDPIGGGTPPPSGDDGTEQPGVECPDSKCTPVCEVDCEETTEDSDICPQPLGGRTLITLVNVAGRNHEFQFSGEMNRVNPLVGRSPAWYRISGPTASKDTWWIAESGNIQLVCWGRWHLRNSVWLGTVVVQATDLHMVMGPGHPDF
jgi:hypothetical protein